VDKIRTLLPGDVEYIAANLRDADRCEMMALHGPSLDVYKELTTAVLRSSSVWVFANENPVAVFGVVALTPNVGSPWLLGTEEAYQQTRAWLRSGRRYLALMQEEYPVLMNYVDSRNERSIGWLKRLGFEFQDAQPIGPYSIPFHRFQIGS